MNLNNPIIRGELSPQLVDEFSELVTRSLKDTKLSGKDVLRIRLSVETAMGSWLAALPQGAPCTFQVRRRFGKMTVAVTCEGPRCDPREADEEAFGDLADSSLLQTLGLTVGYAYENGINRISFVPASGLVMQIVPMAAAVLLGLGTALLLKSLFPALALRINEQAVTPVFDAMMNLLKTIAGPMIFLAVLSGIYGIGDLSALGKIGRQLIVRYVVMTYFCLLVSLIIILPLVTVTVGAYDSSDGAVASVIGLVLQFIPTDIVSPFLNGNMLQIIFLAIACGIGTLILGDRVSSLCRIIDQIYAVVQLLMEAIGKMIPLFVFLSLFSFVLSNSSSELQSFIIPLIVIAGSLVLIAFGFYGLRISLRYRISPVRLFRKLLPTFLIAFTTASSAAAFSVNVETCERELGIAPNLTKFGIPLGQVVYMPLAAIEFLSISMLLAQNYAVTITPLWIATAVFVCGILAIATPPIPGGALSILTVMFLQLNIPTEALAIAISIDLIADYIVTAGDIICLQEELILCADKTGLLNVGKLRK